MPDPIKSDASHCRHCGTSFTSEAAQGLCPACLLEQGMGPPGERDSYAGAAGGDATVGYSAAGGHPPGPPGGAGPGGGAEPSLAEVARLFPQLEVMELLGRGGMGIVYKARQRGLDRLVALKILTPGVDRDPGFQERFVREARALARLSHPNIVAVHDFGQVEGRYWFLMEYVDGANLRRMLQAGQLTPAEALAIVPQLCDALQFAHEEGIVHRDVKPENILLDRRGRVKVADFGLAKIVGGPGPQPAYTLTESRVSLGTPHYMAPEQFERPATVDHRADIYSMGVVFYEMLTGGLPLGRFPVPSRKVQVDVRLDEVVLRTLEKEPEQRYQRAGEVKTDLASMAAAPPVPPPGWSASGGPAGRAVAGPRRVSRAAVRGAALAALFFAAAGVVFVWLHAIRAGGALPPPEPEFFAAGAAVVTALVGFFLPVATTVSGVVAVGQIRRSRGRVYGMPLAVADALCFPLLALDGLILAVWLMLLEPHGPGDEYRALLLAAVTALSADVWVVARVWRRVTAPLPPQPGEPGGPPGPGDRAPARYELHPRRPARRAGWVALLVVVAFVAFGGCLYHAARRVRAPAATRSSEFIVAETNEGVDGWDAQRYRFHVRGPENCKAGFRVELWNGGKRVQHPQLGSVQWFVPPPGGAFDGQVELGFHRARVANYSNPLLTAEWNVQSNVGATATSTVIEDQFVPPVNVRDSTWGTWTGAWAVVPDRAYTLAVIRGGKGQLLGPPGTSDPAHPPDVEVRLIARFEPPGPHEAGSRITGVVIGERDDGNRATTVERVVVPATAPAAPPAVPPVEVSPPPVESPTRATPPPPPPAPGEAPQTPPAPEQTR